MLFYRFLLAMHTLFGVRIGAVTVFVCALHLYPLYSTASAYARVCAFMWATEHRRCLTLLLAALCVCVRACCLLFHLSCRAATKMRERERDVTNKADDSSVPMCLAVRV